MRIKYEEHTYHRENSYIGNNFKNFISTDSDNYNVEVISARGKEWTQKDFTNIDTIVHVAGIVHKKMLTKIFTIR